MPKHPFQYSLDLLKMAIDETPPLFPQERKKEFVEKYEELASDFKADQEDIDDVLIEFGREKWPYRKAIEAMKETYLAGNEEEYFLENLPEDLKKKFMEFREQGGKLGDIRGGRKLEHFFTPEEKIEIDRAEVKAWEKVEEEAEKLAEEKKQEYNKWLEKFRKEEEEIIKNINRLKVIMRENPDLAGEIRDKIRTINEGFSIAEKDVDLEDTKGAIDYYEGLISG